MNFGSIDQLLDDLSPAVAVEEPAWQDVLDRAERLESESIRGNGRVGVTAVSAGARGGFSLRRRRRPLLIAAVMVVAVLISVTALAVAGNSPWWFAHNKVPFAPRPLKGSHAVLITRGTWNGREWALTAFRSDRGTEPGLCYGIVVEPTNSQQAPQGGTGCGPAPGAEITAAQGARHRLTISYQAGGIPTSGSGSEIRYVAGPVVADAVEVAVTLENGTTLHTATVAAPKGLGLAIRFFAVSVPAVNQNAGKVSTCAQRIAGQVAAMRPAKLVAFDATGRTVAELTVPAQPPGLAQSFCRPHRNHFASPPELAGKPLTTVGRIVGPYGARATIAISGVVGLHLARLLPTGNFKKFVRPSRCWRVSFSNGQSQGTCVPVAARYEPELSPWVQHAGRDTFVFVDAPPRIGAAIARVDLLLANGQTLSKTPVDGVVVFAIPREALSTTHSERGFLTAYDKAGKLLVQDNSFGHVRFTRQPVYYRSCPPGTSCYG
jgi:hypothetical protein